VRQEEGTNGISDPQLWLYAHGDPNVVGHTSILYDTVSPRWPERDIICFDPAASDDGTFCVQISDDWPRDYLNRGPVLNDGCGPVPLEAGEHSVVLTKGARLWYTAVLAPPPAPPKPPPFDLTGKLNVAKCDAMMRDPTHIFRQMWEARQFMRLRREGGIPCFERAREDISRGQASSAFFADVKEGKWCDSNWYEGVPGDLGDMNRRPRFSGQAPALLGFDETIDDFCVADHRYHSNGYYDDWSHAGKCANSNNNILALWGNRLTYNMCRNLEWQMCAAKGLLPGQGGHGMRFSYPPKELDVFDGGTGKALDRCQGWKPPGVNCQDGFGTDDIFYLESCLYSFVCKNNEELFSLKAGEFYVCKFDGDKFDELQGLLESLPA